MLHDGQLLLQPAPRGAFRQLSSVSQPLVRTSRAVDRHIATDSGYLYHDGRAWEEYKLLGFDTVLLVRIDVSEEKNCYSFFRITVVP
jgi:hypothetical protein